MHSILSDFGVEYMRCCHDIETYIRIYVMKILKDEKNQLYLN